MEVNLIVNLILIVLLLIVALCLLNKENFEAVSKEKKEAKENVLIAMAVNDDFKKEQDAILKSVVTPAPTR